MFKRLIQLLTLAALVNLVYHKWPRAQAEELFLIKGKYGKYGYVDRQGRVRIEPVFDEADQFDAAG